MKNPYFKQVIKCSVKDCVHYENKECQLSKINVSQDSCNAVCEQYEKNE